eukprot:Gb_22903 [translate_table: standard]
MFHQNAFSPQASASPTKYIRFLSSRAKRSLHRCNSRLLSPASYHAAPNHQIAPQPGRIPSSMKILCSKQPVPGFCYLVCSPTVIHVHVLTAILQGLNLRLLHNSTICTLSAMA